jgi:hypothetical protein
VRNKGRGAVSRLTLPGRVVLERLRYARADGSSVVPVDAWIDQAGRLVSLGVRQLGCRLVLDAHSFARAAANLRAAAALTISAETLRQLVEAEGRRVVHAQTHEQLSLDWEAKDCLTPTPQGPAVSRVYLSCDGVMVPVVGQGEKDKRRAQALAWRRRAGGRAAPGLTRPARRPLPAVRAGADQKYKEFKIVAFYDQDHTHTAVRATRRDHRHAGRLMRRMAGALGLRQAQEKAGLMDGAGWIARAARANVPCLDRVTLDLHHLGDHVHQARGEVFGEQAPTGWAWAEQVLHTVKHEGYAPFWAKLVDLRTQTRSPRKRAGLDGLMSYVAERREMLDYPEHLRRGWDIGSGPVESMCKALTGRLKGRGMRWDADHAEAIMALEALVQSQQWSSWWENRAGSTN